MSSSGVQTGGGTRRQLTERQAETVARLVGTGRDVLREQGYDGLTVRNVAAAAGVAPATAYTYFASKDHLIAEVFWRDLASVPSVERSEAPPAQRVTDALAPVSLLLVDEPTIAAAITTAMLGSDPEVKRVRDRIGATLRDRLVDALGDEADDDAVVALGLLFSGAMLQAGMGNLAYTDLPAVVARTTALVLGEPG
jgi:AcrR family transcriptional regulator